MTSMNAPSVGEAGSTHAWEGLARVTGVSGLAGLVLLFGPVIAISSLGEPSLAATPEDARSFFANGADAGWTDPLEAVATIGMLGVLWFAVGLSLLLRRLEGEPPWRSTIALVSGVLLAAYGVLDSSWEAAMHQGNDLDPTLAAYAFHVGNIGFTNAWLAMGSFAVAGGWVVLTSTAFARWTGWCAVAAGVGLVLARFLWTVEGVWFLPYALFWVWVVATCIRLLRRPTAVVTAGSAA